MLQTWSETPVECSFLNNSKKKKQWREMKRLSLLMSISYLSWPFRVLTRYLLVINPNEIGKAALNWLK